MQLDARSQGGDNIGVPQVRDRIDDEVTNKIDIMGGKCFNECELLMELYHAAVCDLVLGDRESAISARRDLVAKNFAGERNIRQRQLVSDVTENFVNHDLWEIDNAHISYSGNRFCDLLKNREALEEKGCGAEDKDSNISKPTTMEDIGTFARLNECDSSPDPKAPASQRESITVLN